MRKLTRRTLLAALGAGAASVPMLPRILQAQGTAGGKRLVVFFSPNEPIDKTYWDPTGSGADRPLPSALPRLMSSLDRHRSKLLFIGDMRMETRARDSFGGGHVGTGHLLTGEINIPYGSSQTAFWGGGISVDQYIANRLGVSALTLGVDADRGPGGANNGNCRISYRGANQPVTPLDGPRNIFDSVFADVDLSPAEVDLQSQQRASVLDAVGGNLTRTRDRLGAHQHAMLERHLDAVASLRSRLDDAPVAASCDPTAPATGGDYPTRIRKTIDVLVEALACGVSDVATLQCGNSSGAEPQSGSISWPSEGISFPVGQHVVAHEWVGGNATQIDRRERMERVYYDLFAHLLDRMDAIPEGGGTLLDNSIVLYAKNIGQAQGHRGWPTFYMLAGGGGAFRTDRFLSYPDVPHNDLLVTLCQLMGLSDVTSFGDATICTGDLGL